MKDKAMMMYDYIRSAEGIEPWAIKVLQKVLATYFADGCHGCAFEPMEEWEMPCSRCKRNCKDYWRKAYERDNQRNENAYRMQ